MRIRANTGEQIFSIFNHLFMCIAIIVTLYPMLYIIFASFSESDLLMMFDGTILYKPLGFSTAAYRSVFKNPNIVSGYINTIIIVVGGVSLNILLTTIGAYVLSRKNLMLNRAVTLIIIFTMYFHGGMIPSYLLVRLLHLDNSLLALIIPSAISTFNLIIMRTAFKAVPDSMEESAKLDGASHLRILFFIMIPLTLPTIAVLVLYYGVSHWNSWFSAMLYIRNRNLFPLQLILREIIIQNETSSMTIGAGYDDREMLSETIKYAVIVVATAPILTLYPFLQKYFVKGVMIGALKG